MAERFPRSADVHGDLFRGMVAGSRREPIPEFTEEAQEQLRLRHRLAARAADGYHAAGFTTVFQDCILGEMLSFAISEIRSRPLLVVVLAPSAAEVARRDAGCSKRAYDPW
ncbi:MAG: phosphotransferase, partial [Candidatus Dormibacteria bacterium]